MTLAMRKVAILAAAVSLLLVGGCGSGTDTKSADSANWTMAQARDHYLEIVAPVNEPRSRINGYLSANPDANDLAVLSAQCHDMDLAVTESIKQFEKGKWPDSVQPSVGALVTAARAEQQAWAQCAEATSIKQAKDALRVADSGESSQKAAAVREALKLPGANQSPTN